MTEHGHHLFGRGKSLLEQLLRIGQTRLELLMLEIQEEKLALARQIRLVAIGALCAWLGLFTLILWIGFTAPPGVRSWILGIIVIALLGASIAVAIVIRRSARREPLFRRVVEQLRLDRAALSEELAREDQ